jgi:hypothetical protein
MLHRFSPSEDESLAFIRDLMGQAADAARSRFGRESPELSEAVLAATYSRNPHKVSAFLQALISTRNPDLLVMTWRLLQGAKLTDLHLTYRHLDNFHMRIELSPGRDDEVDVYESADIVDAALLRHIGITKVNGQPLFDGFYPLRLG